MTDTRFNPDDARLTYAEAEYRYHTGRMTPADWDRYRAIWFYSAPRFSNLVFHLPRVRDVNAYLDRQYPTCPDCGSPLTDRTTYDGQPTYCDTCDREQDPRPTLPAALAYSCPDSVVDLEIDRAPVRCGWHDAHTDEPCTLEAGHDGGCHFGTVIDDETGQRLL